ncbi:MAG: hypothetical protein AAGB51_07295 [Planctomycetota bacterium]
MTLDSQQTEILGRQLLIHQIVSAGFEVALPIRDRGVDLVVYSDLVDDTTEFVSVPIQMKAATRASFSIQQKYAKISNLVLAYVWNVSSPQRSEIYALRYPEAIGIGTRFGWDGRASWKHQGRSVTNKPSAVLTECLQEYRATPERWRDLVFGPGRE